MLLSKKVIKLSLMVALKKSPFLSHINKGIIVRQMNSCEVP